MGDTLAAIAFFATGLTYLGIAKVPIIPVVIAVLIVVIVGALTGARIRDYRRPYLLVGLIVGTVILLAWSILSTLIWVGGSGPLVCC
ncbi:hypothetical protein V6G44_002434 [Burkholderia multivorans]|nr:hypothetical protein [Burkholderia multivorans]MDN7402989.1 hypothetical protein [Burkholderia multivorans]MDN7415255.1 hypothetical protein [Burkholderia multivorans]MDN7649134.1 hypothetical protein [Burkholderia multivorans]MDN7686668.1 hypothetical protein [Burkholderia multivorans]